MTNSLANLADLLRFRAADEPERRAYLFLADGESETASLTWAGLDLRARAIAAALTEVGARGERVLLLHPPGLEFVAAFFGCLYAGAVAVPSQPPHRQKEQPRLQAIAADTRPRVVVGDTALVARREEIATRAPELAGAAWMDTGGISEALADAWPELPLAPDSPAFLQYTSGSTSTPKGVIVTHANLLHNEGMIRRAFGQSEESVIVGWLPLYHDMGLIGNVLQPLYAGATCVLMPPLAFLQRPSRWLRAISRYRATTSGGPNFAYDLCVRKVGQEELDLSSWKVAFNGAEPVRAETLERFAAAFAPSGFRREAFYPCYGLAEATLFVSGGTPGAGPTLRTVEPPREGAPSRELVGCGHPWLDQEVVIADPKTGVPLPDGQVGEVLVAGPSVAAGYWGQPEETTRTFRAGPGGRFLRTGDLGFLDGGELFLTGRLKELIILRGRNLYPHDVERTAATSHPALQGGVGAAFAVEMDAEERLVLVHEVARTWRGEVEEVAGAVRQAVALEHEARVQEVVLVWVGSVLRTSSGKIRRRATREAYLTGELAVVARESRNPGEQDAALSEWTEVLAGEAARALRLERVDPDLPLIAQGLDSLAAAELQSAVEVRTGVALSMTALLQGASLRELEAEEPGWEFPSVQAAGPDAPGEHPVSEGQRALWFLDRLAPGAAALHLTGAARVRLDIEALRRAAGLLTRRHAALRTTFHERDGEPVRRVHEWLEPDVREGSLTEAFVPFDLERGPLMRLRVAEGGTALLVEVHHLIADYASVAVLLRDLAALVQQRELPSPGPGYTVWLRRRESVLAGPRGEELRRWWRERLSGELPVLDLPVDRPPRPDRSWRGVIRTSRLGGALLREVGRRRGATLYASLLAGLQVVLHRWTGQDEALIAAPTAGRDPGYEGEIGYFVNPVVLHLELQGEPSFEDLVARAGRTAVESFEHGAWPFARLVRDLRVPPLQAMLVLQPTRTPEERALAAFALGEAGARAEVEGLEMESLALPETRVQSDLTLMAAEVGAEGILLSLQLDADLFDAVTAERLLGHLTNLLTAAAADPGRRVSEIEILSGSERAQIAAWSVGPSLMPGPNLHERIAEQAARKPEAVALVHGEERWTYCELWGQALRLAELLRGRGVGPEVRVGICSARTPDMVAAMLAVLEAGGAYVPLDPAYPAERLALLLEDSGAALVLADALGEERLPVSDLPIVRLGEETDLGASLPTLRPAPENLAWLIYTSGSTGRPKAVGITHGSAAALTDWTESAFPELEGVLASTSIGFDLSIFEILVPLSRGGRVVLAGSALDLPEIPASAGVRLVNTVPSAMSELLRAGALPASVETVCLAGEPLRRALARDLFQAGVRRVVNLYGPSEDTTYSTIADLATGDDGEPPPIGRPIAGTTVRVLDGELRLIPQGVAGELFLGGSGLARGYLGRPDLTAERFVPSPFPEDGPGARLYRTGDRVRWRADGQLAFLGRLDHQVKVRGFRIELGEVEAALTAIPEVEQAAVLAMGEGAERRLVAFLVGSQGDSLRDELAARLPAHMIPSSFVFLDTLPLTPNGKVDRKALAALEPERSGGTVEPPRSSAEAVLAAIWEEVLGTDGVGIHDDFFALGGHSLLATRVVSRVREAFGVDLPLRALFEEPTVAGLARRLRRARAAEVPPLTPQARPAEGAPLSFAQQRLWFFWQLAPDSAFYNMPAAIRLHGPIDPPRLARAFGEIVRIHESLRTRFPAAGGRPVQAIDPPLPVPLPVVDLSGLTDEREIDRIVQEEIRRPFDLAQGPVLRTLLLKLGPESALLVVNLHHIVSDAWSVGVLYREFAAIYRGASPPELPVQYADFTLWQRSWLQGETLARELAWWRERLAGLPPTDLPSDHPRPAVQSFRGATLAAEIPPEVAGQLRTLSRRLGATLFMTLLAGFKALVHRYTGREDVIIGTPVANREWSELERLVGFFVNTLALRTDFSGRPGFRTLVERVRETALEAWSHQSLPFEKIVEELAPERDASRQPIFQQMFQLVDVPPSGIDVGGLVLERLEVGAGTTTFDLALDLHESPDGGVAVRAVYSTDLFDAATVGRLVDHLARLLARAAEDPELAAVALPMLSPDELRQALVEWNDRVEAPPGYPLTHEAFEARVRLTPAAVALVCAGERITYGELNRRANRMAHRLISLGAGPEVVVGVLLRRSSRLVVTLLAVLKAGAVYLPLDPALPRERLDSMLEDAGAAIVIAEDWEEAKGRKGNPKIHVPGEALAYVIYTSGSTGRPKGVGVSYRVLASHVRAIQEELALDDRDTVLQFASTSFDVSLEQLLPPLVAGARVVLRPEEVWTLPELLRRLDEEGVTVADLPTAYWSQLAHEAARGALSPPPPRLRLVLAGGEALRAETIQRWRRGPFAGVRLLNAYGPTETTVTATVADLTVPRPEGEERVPIGQAVAGRALYVLDPKGGLAPAGVSGELFVGGSLLARGYLGRPDQTAERFVPDFFSDEPGARLYRTGDLVRRLPDGRLEFVGRADRQLKVRGFRIEPGEVEAALLQHPAVREAVVVAREDDGRDRRLVAYVSCDAGAELAEAGDWEDEQVEQWREVYDDDVYGELPDPTFNISGWTSSYTRGPIPAGEMREWLDTTVDRIFTLLPPAGRRVLEVGCGTGLVLFRVAPSCARYVGTDFSVVALEHTRSVLDGMGGTLPVELRQGLADDPAALGNETFDAVFLNSVVQYFPSPDYLLRVLEEAVARVEPGGFVFVGDVRSLPLLPAFHASVELHRAQAGTSRERLARRVEAKIAGDPELVIDPAFFAALRQRLPRISHVEIQLRRGRHRNELTRFRYDAVLHVGRSEAAEEPVWLDWEAAGLSLPALRGLLEEAPARIGVRRIPNDRVAGDVAAFALLRDPDGPRTAGELRQAAVNRGIDPEDLWEAARDLPYEVGVTWSRDPGRFDAVLRRREGGARTPMPGLCPPDTAARLASDPLRRRMARRLAPRLKAFATERLPAPMVPADVVILDELPLNVRGKVDLRALPAPERIAPGMEEGFVPPRTPEERAVADVWAELLGLDQVGAGDDFFALGGHSLLATQVLSRVRQGLGVELELRQLFEEPTVTGLAARVREAAARRGEGEGEPPLVPAPRTGPLPLSFGQRRLWFLHWMDPRSAAYNMAGAWRLAGLLDVPALAAALGEITRRHEVLRAIYAAAGEEPVQVVHPPAPFVSPIADLSSLPSEIRDAETRRLVAEEAARPFDLDRGPVLRVTLVRLARREHLALVTVHHIACDGWSIGVLIRELGALYAAAIADRLSPLPETPLQYGDFAAWQRGWLDGPALAARIAWWKDRLAGAPPALELPSDRPRPAVRSQAGGLHPVEVPAATSARLAGIARAEGATLFAVLLAAFQALLGRLTGEDDLVVGTPVAGRRQVETEELIGFFVNTLALRADLAGDPAFRAHLGKTQGAALDAFAHQDLPFERLVEELRPERSLSHAPVFQVLFALQNAPGGPLELPGLTLEPLPPEPRALFDLELNIAEVDGALSGALGYALDLFEPATAARISRHFLTLTEGIAERPEARLSELPLLSRVEIAEILETSRGPALDRCEAATVLDLFTAQAARTPDAEAVAGMTYRELDLRSHRLAVRRGEIVALRAERSADFVVSLLGVMRAGAAWLPLDPSLPEERAAFILQDSGARLVPDGEEGPMPAPPGPGDLAYVIYTSGTTGRPKGVMVEHGSLLHTLRALLAAFPFGPGERMVSIAPFSFDIFLFEVLAPLLTGGSVSLPPIRPSLDIDQLLAELEAATRFHAVPAVLRQVVDRGGCAGLREIYTGGDLVPPELIADARRAFPDARVAVLYGPTEGTIVCAAHPAPETASVRPPLGRPLAGVALELRDRFSNLVPDGVPGEIHIGGPGVARGYLGRPELTAERFLPAPGGARVYRTGDLARRRVDGVLEFLGRADDQVKVRGFRIEPGEIETRLAEHPGVRRAAIVVRSNGGLTAFVVPSGEAPSPAELRAHLLRTLPDYMVPAVFAPLAELPLTANAKVDRRALAARPLEWTGGETEAPRTPEEEIVAGLWAGLLGVERIGPRDDVFERGAHSLLVTRAVSRLREAFGVELPLRTLFEEPTPAGQARRIAEARAVAAPPIRPVPREGELPLSFSQQRLWFLEQMEPGNPLYNMPAVLRLLGPLDAGALALALTGVTRRHEALRTVFPARRGRPRQEILPPALFPLPLVDLESLPPERREAEAWSLGQAETRRPFDLAAGPLLRGVLLRLDPAEHVLALNAHHIVSDGWSTAILIRETAALYGGPAPLPDLPVQYADFAVWQRERLAGETLEAQLAWWRRRLEGVPPALELPTDRPRPSLRGLRGAEEPVHLPLELVEGLVRLGRREGATLFMTLLAGFQSLLHRWSGQDDVSVGAPVAGRGRIETEGLIGFFVNTLVMRTDLAGDPSFRRLLARVREGTLDAWAHQDLPFEKLVEELDPVRDPARTPLFQVAFALQDRMPETGLPGLEMVPLRSPSVTAKFDLTLTLMDGPEGLTGAVEYSTDLFDPVTVRRLMAGIERLLRGAVEDPDLGLAALPLLGEAEWQQVAVEWAADTRAAYPRERTVHELFAERAARVPDLPALSHGGERLTYAELDARADRLARRLWAAGVGPEEPVAVLLERSAGLIVALLAVLKAGGAYVPLDPSYPPERLAWMLDDCGARLLVAESLPAGLESGVRVLRPGEDGPEMELLPPVDPEGLAYIIYTSGSTGRPKGVEVPHRGIVRLVRGADFAPLGPGDRVSQGSNAAFDAATFEIWGALLNGAELVVAPPRPSLEELGEFVERERITTFWLTTSLFHQMVDGPLRKLAGVRQVLTGGEVISVAHVRRFLSELPGRRLINFYGPTENTTFTSWYPVDEAARAGSPLPIGRPIANTRVYLLDTERRPVPPGVVGELCTAGDGLARGYLRRPELTAERFVPDPFGEPGSRLYRTGDLARWLPDGTIEFLGRLDNQVKLRGFRVEPGEIEAAAAAHPEVQTAVVLPRPDGAGGKRLVSYLVPSPDAARDTAGVRAFLRGRLPDYMVPSAFVWLEVLPVNQSGKVDRRALERVEVGPETREVAAPRTPIEEGLAGIWRDVLGVDAVGPEDDFFDLGGHSLLATQVASRVREAFGVELPLRDLFVASRLDALAARIDEERRLGAGLTAPPVTPVPRAGGLPLSFAQEWMWVVDQLSPSSEAYNAPIPVRLRGPLDIAALEAAWREVARRHEILRTRFIAGPLQQSDPALIPPLFVADLTVLPTTLREPEAALQATAEATRSFDLAAGPPARALLLRLAAADHLLVLNLHHIVTDGWSAGVLLRELAALYDAARSGSPSPLPALPVQYGDFAAWQRRWLSGEILETLLAYWRERLEGPLPVLELPVDRPGAAPGLGERLPFQLGREGSVALHEIARGRGTTLFVVLLAAFQILLSRYSRQEDLVVGTPVANRTRRELEDLIGYFVNNLALRTDLGGDPGFPELLDRVHETTLGAWSHQDLPILKLIQELHPERAAGGAMPLFRVWFQLQNTPLPRLEVPGLTLLPYELESRAATFDLELLTLETDDGIAGHFVYSRELFLRGTAEAMLRNLLALIEGIAAHPGRRLSDLPLLAPEEREALLHDWNPSGVCPGAVPLHLAFEAVAAARPEAPAVTFEGETLTYGQLDRRANALAHRLRALGVCPESRVGLSAGRSLELVIGILGILKAGGAYVPLDPDYPRERVELLLEDARVQTVVTSESLRNGVEAATPPDVVSDPDHLAYVIYTSGSTGRPKGVMIPHRQAARLFEATRSFGFGLEDVWTLFHSYAFDFSVWELWGALLHGGRLVVVPRWVSRSPEAFLDLLAREGVTVLNQTPSAFYQLIQADAGQPLRLRWVIFGGEALEPLRLQPWFERRGDERPVLVNMYGITETTVHVTLRPLTREDSRSVIGHALDDLRLYLLDAGLGLAPVGAVGEIFVGGGGVARGYLGRPELTAERFVPDPFAAEPGARLYRSGDLARWRPGGELEYLGRADQQLKVRGFRIEPGEIEAALVRHPAVAQAAVVARRFSSEDVRLAACVVAREVPSAGELREHLLALLPEPWVPGIFVPVPALPLTPHGKVDRRALDEIVAAHTATVEESGDAPASPLEELLAQVWAGLLEVDHVGRDESFFALGGHSLQMTRVASRVREALGVAPPMRSFFDRPTVANLAAGLLGELAARLEPDRLEALAASVREMPDAEVASLVAAKRAALLARVVPSVPVVPAPTVQPISVTTPARVLPGNGALERLAARGDVRIHEVLAAMADTPARDEPLRVETIAFPTHNRPEVLERGIASYAEAAREHVRFAVLDDSPDPAVRDEYRQRLAGLRRRFGVEILYAGQEEKRRFREDLVAAGIPPEAVAMALTDPEGVGVPVGANRNCVLLQTLGEGALSVDDDTVGLGGPPPESLPGVAFLSGTEPGTAFLSGRDPGAIHGFGSRAEALAAVGPGPVDLPGVHEALLGRELRPWLAGLDLVAPAALDASDSAFLHDLERGGRVLVTTNGWAGDCGWRSPTFYMLLTGDSWRRMTRSPEAWRAATASKEIVRFLPRPTVGNGDSFMATLFTGLDNRRLLPPFPPVLWGEDLLFGITLQLGIAGARVGHLPGVAVHDPMEHRAFWPGEMVRSASGVDHSRLVAALLDGFAPDPDASPEEGLRRLGAFLMEHGGMAPRAFDELAGQRVRARAEAFAAGLEARLAVWNDGDGWTTDVRRYLDLLRRHMGEPDFAVPLDLLYGREPEEARRLAQRLILNHGKTLAHWPDLVEAARALKARGHGLAEAIP